jgi:hypothetical protein
MEHEIL